MALVSVESNSLQELAVPEHEVPDVYSDQFSMAQTPYGITFIFSLTPSNPSALPGVAQTEPKAIVRMSLEHAKVMAMMIRRNLQQYELEHLGDPIRVPPKILADLRLDQDEW